VIVPAIAPVAAVWAAPTDDSIAMAVQMKSRWIANLFREYFMGLLLKHAARQPNRTGGPEGRTETSSDVKYMFLKVPPD
jgi:hypothetical protein